MVALLTYKQATKVAERAKETKHVEIEAGAYERARQTFESMISQLQLEVNRLQSRYDKVFEQLGIEQESSASLRAKVAQLQTEIDTLQRTIAQMRIQLAGAGIVAKG